MERETAFGPPTRSATEKRNAMSLLPMYGRMLPEATVETMSFGNPMGSPRMAMEPMAVPWFPPIAIAPSRRPDRKRSSRQRAAPAPIRSMIRCRSGS